MTFTSFLQQVKKISVFIYLFTLTRSKISRQGFGPQSLYGEKLMTSQEIVTKKKSKFIKLINARCNSYYIQGVSEIAQHN
jgi:hypothetical protein